MDNYTFEDYCEDHLDMHIDLMTSQQRRDARAGYRELCAEIEKEEARNNKYNKKALENAKKSRKLAKLYGGKALRGTAKQKSWAESIRHDYLLSDATSIQEKEELVTCGGFTETAKFWIENREVPAQKMTARNIVAQYNGLVELDQKHADTMSRTCEVYKKDAARDEIKAYLAQCDFKFESRWV